MARYARVFVVLLVLLALSDNGGAQTTELTYQGQLQSSSAPANGPFDFEFALFDSAGTPIGPVLPRNGVTVTNGIFAVNLDFGSNFPGGTRLLEIRVRPSSGGTFTTLAPRQPIASAPYAVKSLTASSATTAAGFTGNLGGDVTGTQSATSVTRLQGRDVAATAPANGQVLKYNTATNRWQPDADNTGTGCGEPCVANVFNAGTQYNLAGNRLISAGGTNNLFIGNGAAAAGPTGVDNTYIGNDAGNSSTTGAANTFVGVSAGFNNQGTANTFVGRSAGFQTTTGDSNSFFGVQAGRDNTIGDFNSYFGRMAGQNGSSFGCCNSFFGYQAGLSNTASHNSFFGYRVGPANTVGTGNTFFGAESGSLNTTGGFNVFVGSLAGFSNSNGERNVFVGDRAGFANCTTNTCTSAADGSRNVFVGKNAGEQNRVGRNNSFIGQMTGFSNVAGSFNTAIGNSADVGTPDLLFATAIGSGAVVTASNHVQLGRVTVDTVAIGAFGTPSTSTAVCINGQGVFTACASSMRYKTGVQPLRAGLSFIRQLRPIIFQWKETGMADIGFGAEDVAAVDPQFTFQNGKGETEGVKYTQISAALVNAIKEQQSQIERLAEQVQGQRAAIARQQRTISRLLRGRR